MRRATSGHVIRVKLNRFQSTLSMRRATAQPVPIVALLDISIHALHEESDYGQWWWRACADISIHALHEESDLVNTDLSFIAIYFNPRSP